MASSPIDYTNMPKLPKIGYYSIGSKAIKYDTGNTENPYNNNYNSYTDLQSNLSASCSATTDQKQWTDTSIPTIYNKSTDNIKSYLPKDSDYINNLDIPYYLAKSGKLIKSDDSINLKKKIDDLLQKCPVVNNVPDCDSKPIVNQIQYLTCQLQKERNRKYDPSQFGSITKPQSMRTIFDQFSNIKYLLALIFILSMYLFISGLFGSLDLATNIFSVIENEVKFTYGYWLGLLFGLACPVIILCTVYSFIVCKSLDKLEENEITNDAYGIKADKDTTTPLRNFDILTLVLFVLLLYAFVATLFTFKKKDMNVYLYTGLVGFILFIIAIFIYLLFAYVPFFNSTDSSQVSRKNQPRPLRLFVTQNDTPETIESNQADDAKTRQTFLLSFVFIIVLAVAFLGSKTFRGISGLNGLLSSSAILALPALWVLNFVIVISYFYVYPVILMMFRFIRYAIMSVIYLMASGDTEGSAKLRDKMSDDLLNNIDNFKNYSAPWGLIGVDELKIFIGLLGIENTFSKDIISDNNNSSNISNNKFVSSGFLSFAVNYLGTKDASNLKGIIFSVICFFITIIVSMIILYGVSKSKTKDDSTGTTTTL